MTNKLLPCPFCGGKATMTTARLVRYVYYQAMFRNKKCVVACYGMNALSKDEAAKAWNRRAGDE